MRTLFCISRATRMRCLRSNQSVNQRIRRISVWRLTQKSVRILCPGDNLKSKWRTQWVCGVRPRRGFFSTEIIKIKCPKGIIVSKINGIWCPRRAAGFVKEGQCSGRKGPGKGRSPADARAPLSGPGREGRRLLQRLRPPLGPRRSKGLVGPASWPYHGCGFVRRLTSLAARKSLHAPFLDPRGHQRACTGKRPASWEEACSAYHSGGDEAPLTSGVPHHAPPDLAVFSAPPLSHTHSRRDPGEGRRLRDGVMLIIRGRQPTHHSWHLH